MSNEKLVQLQLALFFNGLDDRPDKFINKIDEALEGVFDQMPTIVPIPNEAPPEIPRVTMQSSNGLYLCNISKNRIDFVMNCVQSSDAISVNLEKFIKKVHLFAEVVFDSKSVTRFGFVGTYFFKQIDPIKIIKAKYFKNDFGDLSELGIKFNKVFQSNNYTCNDNIDINKGGLIENNGPHKDGIMIVRDVNNIPNSLLQFDDLIALIKTNENKFKLSGISELIL